MNAKPKIVIVTNLYPSSVEPVRGLYIAQLAQRLRNYYDIQVIAPIPWLPHWLATRWRKGSSAPVVEQIDGITVHHPRYVAIPKILRFSHGYTFAYTVRRALTSIRKDFRYSLISVHWMFPDTFGTVRAAARSGIPIVAHALGCDINDYLRYPLRRKMIGWALKRCAAVVTKSSEIESSIVTLGVRASRVRTIHNGIDRSRFRRRNSAADRRELEVPSDKKLVLFVGNLSPEKCVDSLLKAFAEALPRREGLLLWIVGDGPLRSALTQIARDLEIDHATRFHGQITHGRIPAFLAAADVLCLPSLREGCPNVVLESLAIGTPVAASSVGAIPEMAANSKICFTSEPADIQGLANNLVRAIDLPDDTDRSFQWPSWDDNARAISEVFAAQLNRESAQEPPSYSDSSHLNSRS